jgi:hypothetical protein
LWWRRAWFLPGDFSQLLIEALFAVVRFKFAGGFPKTFVFGSEISLPKK